MNIDKLVSEIQEELKIRGIDNQYFFKSVLFAINENDELIITYKECDEKEQFQQIVNHCIAKHDPTPLPTKPSKDEELLNYILDVDFRLIMLEMGLI